jgi:hypothetical protein
MLLVALSGCAKSVTTVHSDGGGNSDKDGAVGDGGVGSPCQTSEDCDSGLCLAVGLEFICSMPCGPCPDGTYCAHVDPQSAPPGEDIPPAGFYCLPDRYGLCKPCVGDMNCAFVGDRCLDLGDGNKVCGRDCSYDQTCPVGYECRENQCWPIGNTCDCTPERVGAVRRCEVTNTHGTCYGLEECFVAGWEGCDARDPGPEVCNGIDDNCDGILPSDELDNNNNGTPDCLDDCVPTDEVCDLVDNDCNQAVDDGDPLVMCGPTPHGTPACDAGQCVVGSCEPDWVDLDGDFGNGCECQVAMTGGRDCANADDVGSLDDTGQSVTRTGVLMQGDEVWYKVTTIDVPDGQSAPSCDNYHFRVVFLSNPGTAYLFDVIETDCSQTPVCTTMMLTDFQWYYNFRTGSTTQEDVNAKGECDCLAPPGVPGIGVNECTDNSTVYFIRVTRDSPNPATCEGFEIEFSNGVYPPP